MKEGYTKLEWMRLCRPPYQRQKRLPTMGEEFGPKEATITHTAAQWKVREMERVLERQADEAKALAVLT